MRLLLHRLSLGKQVCLSVNSCKVKITGDSRKQFGKLQFIQNDRTFRYILRCNGFIAGLHFQQLFADFFFDGFFVKGVEIILLVQLYALLFSVEGRDGFNHSLIISLLLIKAKAVGNSIFNTADKHLHAVQIASRRLFRSKNAICNFPAQLGQIPVFKVRGNLILPFFLFRKRIELIGNQLSLLNRLANQFLQLRLRCGRIHQKAGIALKFAVIHIDGYFLIEGIRVPHRFQFAFHKEVFRAFCMAHIYLIAANILIRLQ